MLNLTPRTIIRRAAVAVTAAAAVLTISAATPAHAEDYLWPDTSTVCIGSGAGTGMSMAIAVTESTPFTATHYGEEVYYQVWLHVYNPATGRMWYVQLTDWDHYTLRENGAGSSGSISWDGGQPTVNIGGTTAPGVWRTPVKAWAYAGLWVKPYVRAYTASGGYAFHSTPIDANSVQTDPTWGCRY